MIKGSTFAFTCIAVATGIALFHIKYQVVTLEKEYSQTQNRIIETQEAIHVLRAEWAHLNNPRRLHTLSEKYLHIHPIQASQFIPMRRLAQSSKAYDQYALNQLIAEVSDIAKNGTNAPLQKQTAHSTKKIAPKVSAPSPSGPKTQDPIGDLIENNLHMVSQSHQNPLTVIRGVPV